MIQSVERAFKLLYTIGHNEDQSNISQLARDVNLPRTTVVRLLDTLQAVGAVKTDQQTDDYLLGDKLIALLNSSPWVDQIAAITQPYLQDLALTTGETAYLGIPDGNSVYYVTQIDSQYTIQMKDWSGQYTPLHPTAVGKLILAYSPTETRNHFLAAPLERYTDFTLTDPPQLQTDLATIQETGVSWSREEFEVGCINLGAPIFNQNQHLVAAVAIGMPKYRLENRQQEKRLAQLVSQAAQQISQHL